MKFFQLQDTYHCTQAPHSLTYTHPFRFHNQIKPVLQAPTPIDARLTPFSLIRFPLLILHYKGNFDPFWIKYSCNSVHPPQIPSLNRTSCILNLNGIFEHTHNPTNTYVPQLTRTSCALYALIHAYQTPSSSHFY